MEKNFRIFRNIFKSSIILLDPKKCWNSFQYFVTFVTFWDGSINLLVNL